MLRKKLTYLVLLSLFLQLQARGFSWLDLFNDAMTCEHNLIVCRPFASWVRSQYLAHQEVINLLDASPEVSAYVKWVLRQHNCPAELVDSVQIKVGKDFKAHYSFNGKHIIILPNYCEKFVNKDILLVEAFIRHEAAHLEHKDRVRMGAFLALSTLLVHYGVNGITHPISCLLQPYTPAIVQAALKIPLAAVKAAIIYSGMIVFARYKEYEADKKAAESIKNPAVLRAMAAFTMQIYEQYERDQKLDPNERGTWDRFFLDEALTPDISHPNYLLRSQLFADAAQRLEDVPQAV